jgi:hypothetical protein
MCFALPISTCRPRIRDRAPFVVLEAMTAPSFLEAIIGSLKFLVGGVGYVGVPAM